MEGLLADRRRREDLQQLQHQAAPLNLNNVHAIRDGVDMNDPRALRDATFASVAYDLLARASELVAMRWNNIQFRADDDVSSDKITTANATSNNNSELGTPIINGIMAKVMGTAPRKPTQLI